MICADAGTVGCTAAIAGAANAAAPRAMIGDAAAAAA